MAVTPAVTAPPSLLRQRPETRTGEFPRVEIDASRAGEPPQPRAHRDDEPPMPTLAAEPSDPAKFAEDNMSASQP